MQEKLIKLYESLFLDRAMLMLGLLFLITPLGKFLRNWSYDYAFFFRPKTMPDKAVVVYMDDDSHQSLAQRRGPEWRSPVISSSASPARKKRISPIR